jgi:hypothetical protein
MVEGMSNSPCSHGRQKNKRLADAALSLPFIIPRLPRHTAGKAGTVENRAAPPPSQHPHRPAPKFGVPVRLCAFLTKRGGPMHRHPQRFSRSQSSRRSFIKSTTVEKTLVGCVLFNVGRLAFLRSIRMMLMLRQITFWRSGCTLARCTLFAPVSRRNRRHFAHDQKSQVGMASPYAFAGA